VLLANIRGIPENLAAYTAPFQIADASLHLTLRLKKTCQNSLKNTRQCRSTAKSFIKPCRAYRSINNSSSQSKTQVETIKNS